MSGVDAGDDSESEKFLSETAVIKGLLTLGEKTGPAKLLKVMKEVL